MPEIGATLREARMRARIDVSEIEAKTKIRAKYLRALENEEWGLLPGPTFVKSFLRTYAQALDLDAKALVEEYRSHNERPSEAMLEPIVSTPQSKRPRGRGSSGGRGGAGGRSGAGGRGGSGERASRGYIVAVGAIGVVIVVLIVALVAGGGGSSKTGTGTTKTVATHSGSTRAKHGAAGSAGSAARRRALAGESVALSLRPTGVVYVCLIGEDGRKLIPGVDLPAGETTPTYHAKRFEITLGNSSVTLLIDGIPRTVPPSSRAIGYSITKLDGRRPLTAGQLPTCT
jgi:cytoskeleton protein RodZ